MRLGRAGQADGEELADELTASGQSAYTRIFAAVHDRIERLLDDWHPEQHPRLRELLSEIRHELAAGHERPGRDLDRVS